MKDLVVFALVVGLHNNNKMNMFDYSYIMNIDASIQTCIAFNIIRLRGLQNGVRDRNNTSSIHNIICIEVNTSP